MLYALAKENEALKAQHEDTHTQLERKSDAGNKPPQVGLD